MACTLISPTAEIAIIIFAGLMVIWAWAWMLNDIIKQDAKKNK